MPWLARGLALILMLPFAMGGANSAVLTAATAVVNLGWAALALVTLPSDSRLVGRMAPAALPLGLLLGWTALPFGAHLAPGLIAPPPLRPICLRLDGATPFRSSRW